MIELDEVTCPVCGKEQPCLDNLAIGYPDTPDHTACDDCSCWEDNYHFQIEEFR